MTFVSYGAPERERVIFYSSIVLAGVCASSNSIKTIHKPFRRSTQTTCLFIDELQKAMMT